MSEKGSFLKKLDINIDTTGLTKKRWHRRHRVLDWLCSNPMDQYQIVQTNDDA